MYGPEPAVKRREPVAVERVVDCPMCDAAKGQACVLRGWKVETGEHAEVPHNKRYLAAGLDPYQP